MVAEVDKKPVVTLTATDSLAIVFVSFAVVGIGVTVKKIATFIKS